MVDGEKGNTVGIPEVSEDWLWDHKTTSFSMRIRKPGNEYEWSVQGTISLRDGGLSLYTLIDYYPIRDGQLLKFDGQSFRYCEQFGGLPRCLRPVP